MIWPFRRTNQRLLLKDTFYFCREPKEWQIFKSEDHHIFSVAKR
ncbi:MAG: hypothetical protein ACI9BK_001539 [Acidimicrobiales bacterium]